MNSDNLRTATAYYTAINNKDLEGMKKCLHPNVKLIGPLACPEGRDDVLDAAVNLSQVIDSLAIRAKFESDELVMLALDTYFPEPIGNCRTASLLTFKDNLIINIELFLDARPITEKKQEIYS